MEWEPNNRYVRLPRLFDYEQAYRERRGDDALIELNDIDLECPDHNEQIMRLTHSRSSGTDFIARCECGDMVGTHYRGQTCPKCRTKVLDDLDDATGEFPMRVWIRTPGDLKWLHPTVFMMLRNITQYAGRSTEPRTYLDDYVNLAVKDKDLPDILKPFIGRRGFTGLRENWDEFLDVVLASPKVAKKSKAKIRIAQFREVVRLNKDRLWISHQPILFSSVHAIILSDDDDESRKKYTDRSGRFIFQIASALSWLESQGEYVTEEKFHRSVYRIYTTMLDYLDYILKVILDKKRGILRQHVFGARHHWTLRAVITPLVGKHEFDELHLPWSGAVNLLRVHIVGRLIHEYGMYPSDALAKQNRALVTYDEDIAKIMDRFIEESPFKGIPFLFGRNPSVDAGSIGLFFGTRIKTDVFDKTIGVPSESLGRPNGDFDGDEMTAAMLIEADSVRHFMVKHASRLYVSRDNPEIAHFYGIPKALTIVANEFLGALDD